MSGAELAQKVHSDGFVVLSGEVYKVSPFLVELVRAQVLQRYEGFLTEAANQQLDLTLCEHSERLSGFYVRQGGRIDMQLSSSAPQTHCLKSDTIATICSLDMNQLNAMTGIWQSVLKDIFAPDGCQLEYVGCVLSRPGDADQNWHLDGIHRNQQVQEPVDRINVFVPLVAITDKTGGTEMKTKSHLHENGTLGTAFEDYTDLPSVTACVDAGTPIIMDYRVWHRGLANTSQTTVRPLLYFKYARMVPRAAMKDSAAALTKKRKQITPTVV